MISLKMIAGTLLILALLQRYSTIVKLASFESFLSVQTELLTQLIFACSRQTIETKQQYVKSDQI